MEPLSPLDESFLHLETEFSQMHIASVAIFEGPPPPYEDMLGLVEAKLGLVPRYRQKVRFVPLALGRPCWVDDPHFHLQYHVRHTALPSPGSEEQLRNLVGRVMAQRLDRARPLWEMWIAEGLAEGRWALLSKAHHCLVDGIAGSDLLEVVLDRERDPEPPPVDDWEPKPEPSGVELLGRGLLELANPAELARSLESAARAPRTYAAHARDAIEGLASMRGLIRRTPPFSINGPLGPHRRWAWARTRLSDVKTVRTALGGTVNDVVLTLVSGGFRDLLLSRGEDVDDRVLRSLVPVSVRASDARGTPDNRVSALFAELPIGIEDPLERLEAIRLQMKDLKESKGAVAGEALTSLSGFAPPMLLALGERVAAHVGQRNVNTVTTNVPGPQYPLYAAGRRMLEAFPYVPLAGNVRVGVAIFSYDGGLNYGVTGDYDTAPDLDVLCSGIEDGLRELLRLAGETAAAEGAAERPEPAVEPEPKA
jgi:diacylglycerol O-acyltransferase / wax synthase